MQPTLRENLIGLRPIRGLLISVAIARSSVMLFPFYAAYLRATRNELSPAMIGLIIGVFGIGALAADAVSGALTRRVSERAAALIGMVGVSVAVVLIALTSSRWALLAETVIWGFCYELINPVTYTLVARAMPESRRRFAFAAVRLAINVGMGIGPVMAGLLFKVEPGLLVAGTAVGYLAAAGVLARAHMLPQERVEADTPGDAPESADRARSELRFWSFFTATLPIHFAYALPPTVVSTYIIQELGHAPGWVSLVFGLNAFMVITCEISLNHAMNQWPRRRTMFVGFSCAIAGFGLMGFGSAAWVLIPATLIWTLGEMIIFPVLLDHISVISLDSLKSRNMGLYGAGVNSGVLVAPAVFLPLSTVLDPVACWGLVAGLLLVGMAATGILSRMKNMWGADPVSSTVSQR